MVRQRKSDEGRIRDGRGIYRGIKYKTWLEVHEVPSVALSSRIAGWKINRIHHLLSNMERDYFYIIQWEDCVIDIREQYPLLPLEETIIIANETNIKHPSINNGEFKNVALSTDFVITIDDGKTVRDIARTIKPTSKLSKRVKEKYKIEEIYWGKRNIDWGIVTEKEINPIKAKNIRFLYSYYFWDRNNKLGEEEIKKRCCKFCEVLRKNNFNVMKTITENDRTMNYRVGESLSMFKYLLSHKVIKVDINVDITSFINNQIEVWI